MSFSSTIVFLIPILDRTTNDQWSIAMKAYLQVQELWSITRGSEVVPMPPTTPDVAAAFEIQAAYKAELAEYIVKLAQSAIILKLDRPFNNTHAKKNSRHKDASTYGARNVRQKLQWVG